MAARTTSERRAAGLVRPGAPACAMQPCSTAHQPGIAAQWGEAEDTGARIPRRAVGSSRNSPQLASMTTPPLLRRVRFRVVVFRPFRDELLVGKVHKMTE